MIRHPPEFVPLNMVNGNYDLNYNNNGNLANPEAIRHPLRHPPQPHAPQPQPHPPQAHPPQPHPPQRHPPQPGMVDIGLHNNPHHTHHPVPIFSVSGPQMFISEPVGPRGHNPRMMLMMQLPEPVPPEFIRPLPPSLPADLISPNPHNQQEANFRRLEPEDDQYGSPVNFALCKERFNGIGDVRPFINAILDFKYCSEMYDESALRSFSLLLTDQAANWWKANKTLATDWNSAIKLLRNNFRARIQQHRIYRRFFNAAQNEETTSEYVQRTRTLLNKIPMNTLTEETQLDLIFAMLHRRIKDHVNRDDCDSLTDLVERARLVEASMAARATAPPQNPSKAQELAAEEPLVDAEAATKQAPADEEPLVDTEAATKQAPAGEEPQVDTEAATKQTPADVEPLVDTEAATKQTPADEEPLVDTEAATKQTPADVEPLVDTEAATKQTPADEEPLVDTEAATKQEPALEKPASPEEPVKLASPPSPDALATPAPSTSSLASIPISDLDEPFETLCDGCKVYGLLFERTCRKLHKGKRSPQSTALLHELSNLDAERFHKVVCFRCQSDNIVNLKCQKCTHEIAGGCPLISVSIFEMDFNFVVDTGSSHSVASSQLIDHLVACGQQFVYNALIMPIQGVPMRQVFRVANVEMMVAGVMIKTVLVDLPGTAKCVFGMDFIKEAGLMMDFRGEGSWSIRGGDGERPIFYERLSRLGRQY